MPICSKCLEDKPESEFYTWWVTKKRDCWCRKCKREYRSEYQKTPKRKAYEKKYRKNIKNLKAHKAHKAVYYAIKTGKLIKKPCESCGSLIRVQGHHWNYDLPLDVKWMCVSCHRKHHASESQIALFLHLKPICLRVFGSEVSFYAALEVDELFGVIVAAIGAVGFGVVHASEVLEDVAALAKVFVDGHDYSPGLMMRDGGIKSSRGLSCGAEPKSPSTWKDGETPKKLQSLIPSRTMPWMILTSLVNWMVDVKSCLS